MKMLIAALFTVSAAQAAAPSTETSSVVTALLRNPDVVKKLQEQYTDRLFDVSIVPVKEGVSDYTLKFGRSCFCPQNTGIVKIEEDLRPTWSDGAPIYKSSVSFSEER